MDHRLSEMTVGDLGMLIIVFAFFGVPAIVALILTVAAAIRGKDPE